MSYRPEKLEKNENLSPFYSLLDLQKKRLEQIAGDKAVKNFGEAFKLIGEVDALREVAEKSFLWIHSSVETGNEIVELFAEIDRLAKEGKNDESVRLFHERSTELVEKALTNGTMRVSDSVKILGEQGTLNLMLGLVPGMGDAFSVAGRLDIPDRVHRFFRLFQKWTKEYDREQANRVIKELKDKELCVAEGGQLARRQQGVDPKIMTDVQKYGYYLDEYSDLSY